MEMLFAQTGPLLRTCKSWELGALSSWGPLCTCDLAGCICRFSGLSFSVIILGLLVIFNFPIWFETMTKLPNQESEICILRGLERWRRKKNVKVVHRKTDGLFRPVQHERTWGCSMQTSGESKLCQNQVSDSARETWNCHWEEMAIVGLDLRHK